uniref:Uncharacterized protein n=1 Tax=Tetraselmis sp. GSL018 TaxID=582737 RepID=A0A061R1N0_9CHLO
MRLTPVLSPLPRAAHVLPRRVKNTAVQYKGLREAPQSNILLADSRSKVTVAVHCEVDPLNQTILVIEDLGICWTAST